MPSAPRRPQQLLHRFPQLPPVATWPHQPGQVTARPALATLVTAEAAYNSQLAALKGALGDKETRGQLTSRAFWCGRRVLVRSRLAGGQPGAEPGKAALWGRTSCRTQS